MNEINFESKADFGEALTLLRESAGLSVRDVAKALRLPPATTGDYFSGRSLPPVRSVSLLNGILRLCGVTDATQVREWHRALTRLRRRPNHAASPYPGAAPVNDRHCLGGRDRLLNELGEMIADRRRIAVTGAAGIGKSSLLLAGLPAVTPGREVVLTRLGANPCRALSDLLVRAFGLTADGADRLVHTAPAALAATAGLDRAVVVIDQYERFDGTAGTFRAALDALVEGGATLVLGSRSPVPGTTTFAVPALTEPQLRESIERPARSSGRAVDSELVDLLVREHRTLELQSVVLRRTWEHRRHGRLTVADFTATGGWDRKR
ncbi:helix-turn-helix transcriptional regulator [Lentzea sp. NPDC004782]|uniref:helix-turn-helix domain-containing protein n=1 Tax=Lentzea sp. NPDC004782 TaxID=3154458 RepID=UPI0033BAA909